MTDKSSVAREDLVSASRIMAAAGFDPQTGCSEAFNYVVQQVTNLKDGADLGEASREMADHLSSKYSIQLGRRAVDAEKIEAILQQRAP